MTPRPHLDKYRRMAVRSAFTQRVVRVVKVLGILLLTAIVYTAGYQTPRPMNLPEPLTYIIAWTGDDWYKAYMDENYEFRNAETGMPIGQVIRWKKP